MPVTRKRKIEVARLAGFGLVLAGLFALFLAVVSSQNAGAEKPAPPVAVLRCQHQTDNSLGQAVQSGACQTTTSTDTEGATSTSGYVTTTTKHQCGCATTTTYVTTTTNQCGCSTTTSTMPTTTTTEESTTSTATSTSTAGSLPVDSSTTSSQPDTETTVTGQGITASTAGTQGSSPVGGGGDTVGEADAVSGQLPFTGSSSFPLAGIGLLLVASGLALAVRRRRLAR